MADQEAPEGAVLFEGVFDDGTPVRILSGRIGASLQAKDKDGSWNEWYGHYAALSVALLLLDRLREAEATIKHLEAMRLQDAKEQASE